MGAIKNLFLTAVVLPFIAAGAGTFGVFTVAGLAGAAGLVGTGAGEGETEFGAKLVLYFRLGFEASPFVAKRTFDTTAAGARGFGIAQSRAILGGDALGIYGLRD